jgi:ferredoxin--NADP+ reductase
MSKILQKTEVAPKIFEYTVEAPRIAKKAQPGHFIVVMANEQSERIPLTIADFDRERGTITLVLMVVGTSTMQLSELQPGESLFALIGPLGKPSEVEKYDSVVMVAGGVGTAPVYPIARAFFELGTRVISIQGARGKDLLFWTDRLGSVSHQHIVTTDDGTAGRKALVIEPLKELLQQDPERRIACVYAIGPAVMMKACSATTEPFGVKTVVSLNSIMVDGTGMCGGCRVDLRGQTRFTCTDGPEFDGHLVDWQQLLSRQKIYSHQEACSLDRYVKQWKERHE